MRVVMCDISYYAIDFVLIAMLSWVRSTHEVCTFVEPSASAQREEMLHHVCDVAVTQLSWAAAYKYTWEPNK